MTTRVTIAAHCGDENKVLILIMEDETADCIEELETGETIDLYVYDSRSISVKEVAK